MIKRRLDATEQTVETQEQAACCYMRSDKYWITNPQGIVWESFHFFAGIPAFNDKNAPSGCRILLPVGVQEMPPHRVADN